MTDNITPELEAVARAILKADPAPHFSPEEIERHADKHWRDWLPEARAALMAIREPSEGMYEALADKGVMWRDQTSRGVWQAYIDHVLGKQA